MDRNCLRIVGFIILLALLWFSPLQAEEVELEPVVFTATKTEKKLENVPAVVTVIGRDEIETIPARTAGDLLADLPGVYAHEPQGAGLVTPQSVAMRGIGFPGNTLVLLDGQRVNTPFTDYAYLTTIPVRAIERVEVIRGPFSSLYGSSAGGGVINFITKDGGAETYAEPWAKAGNFGRIDYGADLGISRDNFSLGLFFDHKTVDNYFLYDDQGFDDTNYDYDHDRLHAKLTGQLGEKTDISLSGGLITGETGFGIGENVNENLEQDISKPYLNFQADTRINDRLNLRAQLDWLRSDHEYHGETLENVTMVNVGPPPPAPPVMVPQFDYTDSVNDTESDRYRADVSGNFSFTDSRILTMGAEVIYTAAEKAIRDAATGELINVQGRSGKHTDEDDTLLSLYGQYDWMFLEDFELVLGGRYDDYDSYGEEFSPKATLRWEYMTGGQIKLSAGKGFKAPNLNQLYASPWSIAPFIVYQGNPDLEAETMWSYELSLEQRAVNNRLFFRVTPYYTEAENFIDSIRYPDPLNPGGQIMQPENVDDVEITGVDVEISYDVTDPVTLFANYNYNETRDKETDDILDGYPRNSGALGARFRHAVTEEIRVFGSYSARYRDEYTTTSWANPPETENVGNYWFHTASFGLGYKDMISLDVDAYNLFDRRTETDIDRYLPEFNYQVSLSYQYTF